MLIYYVNYYVISFINIIYYVNDHLLGKIYVNAAQNFTPIEKIFLNCSLHEEAKTVLKIKMFKNAFKSGVSLRKK